MFTQVVKIAPRLLKTSSKLNHVPALFKATAVKPEAKVIESLYTPSGHIPHDESYNQIPIVIDGKELLADPELFFKPYPFVPTLEEISIEKQQTSAEDEKEENPEFQIKTLEDKCRVWFGADMPTIYDDQRPERDLVNYPRLQRYPDGATPTRLYFLPESWFKFFESKTGRTGGYVFGATFLTFIASKEIIVYNDNAHIGLSLAIISAYAIKKFGRAANDFMLSHFHKERQGWRDWQEGMKQLLREHVKQLKLIEERSLNPQPIYDAKRENVLLQQEAEYRRRLMQVYNEVKRKLDYQVAIEDAKKSFTRRHLVNWVIDNVNKSVNQELEKAVLKQCVVDLKELSQKRRNAI